MNACRRVRADGLGDPGAAGDPPDDPPGAVPVQPPPVCGREDRSLAPLADGQVDCPRGARGERDGDDLAAFAGDDHSPVPALDAQSLDVRASGFGDPQPVESEQGDQGVLGGRPESGRDEQGTHLVAIQRGGM
jgi:hypothetical protein